MRVKVVVGAHLYEAEEDGTTKGAYTLLLQTGNECCLGQAEKVEFLEILLRKCRLRLQKHDCAAAGELSLMLTIDDLESTLCEYIKFEAARTQKDEEDDDSCEQVPKKRRSL